MVPNETISIVVPVYKAVPVIHILTDRLTQVMEHFNKPYKIIYVEDGSNDDTWNVISKLANSNKNILAIKLSRNFGQHNAITAGLDYSNSDWTVVMDCDLQDEPENIPDLYYKAKNGYHIVFARRIKRQDSVIKKYTSRLFYIIFSYLSGTKFDGTTANFGIYSKKAIDAYKKIRETSRFFPTQIRWIGLSIGYHDVFHKKRQLGSSTYSFSKLLKLGLKVIITNTSKPLRLIVILGFLISFISFIIGIYFLQQYMLHRIEVSGYTSIILSIWFLGGTIIFFMGLIGIYIQKLFESSKNRPLYLIDEILNRE